MYCPANRRWISVLPTDSAPHMYTGVFHRMGWGGGGMGEDVHGSGVICPSVKTCILMTKSVAMQHTGRMYFKYMIYLKENLFI